MAWPMSDETKLDPARVDGSMFQSPPTMNGLPQVDPRSPTADRVSRFASDNPSQSLRYTEQNKTESPWGACTSAAKARRGSTTDPEDG
eukprot:1461809-Pyramimonas_sp.AAC.1